MLLSSTEAARFLGVSLRSFHQHVRSGLQAVRIGRSVRFFPEDVRAWADRQKGGDSDDTETSGTPGSAFTGNVTSLRPASATPNGLRKLRRVCMPKRSAAFDRDVDYIMANLSGKRRSNG
jgi:excisionase family DNA binding protein